MLAPWKKRTNLDSILRSRDINLPTKVGPSSQSYGFSSSHVWMWNWTIKKAEHQRIDAFAGRNINNLRYTDDTTIMAESEEEIKSLLMKVKVESEKVGLNHSENEDHGIRSHHFMGNRWGNSGNSVRLNFGGLQNHCRW